ncbi:MAG: PQQ-dependent sugar dehydrogenase, partial [Myxococcales bacterium]|nr:PQQ-dependent sugar dehydrogenase [Myxococcales bacterium]
MAKLTSWLLPVAFLAPFLAANGAVAQTLPTNFQQTTALQGFVNPTMIRFAPDGRVFVSEKSGRIWIFDDLSDATPVSITALQANVNNYWDRGLLGMVIDPNFPTDPYIYVLYAYDAPPTENAPYWNDACADPVGVGCLVTSRLSRLEIAANSTLVGSEQVLIDREWCQQYPSHSSG